MLPDLAALEYFHFLRPAWGLLIVPWLAMIWVRRRQQARRDMFDGIIAPHLLEHLRLKRFEASWFNPRSVSAVFVLLLLVLLMGPSWRQQPSPLSEDESALIVILDVSSSMQQSDIQPSRLQRAKQKVSDLLALRPDKRTALVAYAGSAHSALALTADHEILNQYLAAIKPNIMPRDGKFPEYALPLVDELLRETSAPATLLFFTDGVGADSTQAFSDWFATRAHQLLVIGIGNEEPIEGVIPLERRALESLAAAGDGHYIALTINDDDMRQANRRIDSHYVIVDDSALPWLDSGYPLVFPAMLLFLLWFRKGWTLTWLWIAVPLLIMQPHPRAYAQEADTAPAIPHAGPVQWFADLWLTGDQQGRLLMQLGRYDEAAIRFEQPAWKAMAYYYDEQFMLAAEYFSRSDNDHALFNEANARAHARDYVRAVNRYNRLLARNPDYPGALHNRDKVQAIIDEINRISASQQQEQGVSGEEKSLDSEDAIPAQGADELSWETAELRQLSAQDILNDPATQDMWLRAVQQDPSNFLAIKFSMQLGRREGDTGSAP
jgi:Ca-activated chloride channel family protein